MISGFGSNPMSEGRSPDGIDWSLTTWEGSRREQIRQWSLLSLDEILAAQEEMAEITWSLRDRPAIPAAASK